MPDKSIKLITIKSAAEQMSYRPHSLYTLIREGRLPAVKIGRSVRIRVTDLETMIEKSCTFTRKDALA
jgi:excisionase family DNA binding protein